MKLQNFLLAGLLVTGLSACSDNTTNDLEGGKLKEYDAYLTINFESPKYTRTLGPADSSTTDSTTVKNAHVYLVNEEGKVVSAFEETITANSTKKIGVAAGKYRVYVVANPGGLTPVKAKGDIQEVIGGVTEDNAKGGFEDGKFLMTTAVNTANILEATNQIEVTAAHGESNPLVVNARVDRMAVKLEYVQANIVLGADLKDIKTSEGTSIFTGDNLEANALKGFVLVNGNESVNLFQSWKNLTGKVEGLVMETPAGKSDSKPMEGYYNPFPTFTEVSVTGDDVTSIKDLTVEDTFNTDPVFTVENRPPFIENKKLTSGKAQTTGVVFRVVIGDGATTYYYVNGIMYTDFDKVKDLDVFKGVNLDSTKPEELRAKGIKVYEKGQMYYTYFIQDQNYTVTYDGTEKTKYHAVHRNSVYKLSITSLARLGDDVPGGGDITPVNPNPDIDPDNLFLQVKVVVNPWVLNENKIEF